MLSIRVKYCLFLLIILLLSGQALFLYIKPPVEAESWFSDIAYNLNWEFTGNMGKGIPWGITWNNGMGKTLAMVQHFIYTVLGVGLFQSRLLSYICGIALVFLVYSCTNRYISKEASIFAALLLVLSTTFWPFLPMNREGVIICFMAFSVFYLISAEASNKRGFYLLMGGFLCALTVEVSWRGITVVLIAYVFATFVFTREDFIKRMALMLAGSLIVFVYWLFINVLSVGWHNFKEFFVLGNEIHWYPLSEIDKIKKVLFTPFPQGLLPILEIAYLFILTIVFYAFRKKYHRIFSYIVIWLAIVFIVMSIVDNQSYPQYLLMYSPFVCILAGVGLYMLFDIRRKLAYTVIVGLVLCGVFYQAGRFVRGMIKRCVKK